MLRFILDFGVIIKEKDLELNLVIEKMKIVKYIQVIGIGIIDMDMEWF